MDDRYSMVSSAMSEDQFFAWAERCEERVELREGVVVMHAGATRDHERIAKRVFVSLLAQCDEDRFDVNKGDFGVRIKPGSGKGTILYPDIVIDPQSADGKERATITPIIVVEVLSASTGYDEHVEKFEQYKVRDSLLQYVVLEQDAAKAYVWDKGAEGWPAAPTSLQGIDAVLEFPAVQARVRLADVYRLPT